MDPVADVQRQLDAVQQIVHIGSWEWNLATDAVSWTDELFRIYGFEPRCREITLEFFLSLVHPDDRARVERNANAAAERGGRFQWLERIVRPDGAVRLLDTIGEAQRGPGGRVVSLLGTCRDVTEESARAEQIRLYTDIVENVHTSLSVWELDGGGRPLLAAFNPASETIARTSLAPFVGKGVASVAPYARGGRMEALLAAVASDRGVHEAFVDRSRDPNNPNRALAMKGFPLPGDRIGLAIDDVTEATVERRLQQAEHQVLEGIAAGVPLAKSLEDLVRAIEEHSPPAVGSVLLLDPDGVHVRHGAGPNIPEAYMKGIDGLPIGPRAGSCGTAAFLKRAVIVGDIEHDPRWEDYRDLALAAGLRACWSAPILARDGRVLGTFAFYYRTPREPVRGDLETIERAARLAAIAVERKQMEEQLRDLSAHVESVLEEERTSIAREIHDDLGQSLTALKMDIASILRGPSGGGQGAQGATAVVAKLRSMSDFTDDLIQRVRRISMGLRPGMLDDLGLIAAIEWQAQEFEARTGTMCTVRVATGDAAIGREASTAAFRVLQEALTNVSRHAQAETVDVRVEASGDVLSLRVRDDGVGITQEVAGSPKSLGVLGMRERARRLGGSLVVARAVPKGTVVAMTVPLVQQVEAR